MDTAFRNRRTGTLGSWGLAVLAVALLANTGCPYLGLGGGGSEKDSKKKKKAGSGTSKDEETSGGPAAQQGGAPDAGTESMESPPSIGGTSSDAGRPRPTRNPFAPQVDVGGGDEEEKTTEAMPNLGPLRQFPISQFRLAGIMSEVTVPTAMFIAPDGRGYMVKEGESIGKRGGVVKDIRSNEVDIEIPPEKGKDEKADTITVKLRVEALPASGGEQGLTKEERELLKRLRRKQEGGETQGGDSGANTGNSGETRPAQSNETGTKR